MKRIVISLIFGLTLALGLPALAALLFFGDTEAIIPWLLYWPVAVMDKLGLGHCGSADLISDKLACMRMAFVIDVFVYPLATLVFSYVAHRILFRDSDKSRLGNGAIQNNAEGVR